MDEASAKRIKLDSAQSSEDIPTTSPSLPMFANLAQYPEIQELILLHLDMRTLLVSIQRLNRQWRDVVVDSPAIQRALFFKSDTRREASMEPTSNPLLAELFPAWFRSGARFPSLAGLSGLDGTAPQPYTLRLPCFLATGASWRRMLVQQSPSICTVGCWEHTINTMEPNTIKSSLHTIKDGLRMGHFYDMILDLVPETSDVVIRRLDDYDRFCLHRKTHSDPTRPGLEPLSKFSANKLELCGKADMIISTMDSSNWGHPSQEEIDQHRTRLCYPHRNDLKQEPQSKVLWQAEKMNVWNVEDFDVEE